MAKKKSQNNPPKRKNLPPSDDEVHLEKNPESKKKRLEVEEAPVQITDTLAEEKDQNTQVSELERKQTEAQTETTMQTEVSDPADSPEGEKDLSPEEKRVLERKLKKIRKKVEKKTLKAAAAASSAKDEGSRPAVSQQALDYLVCWAENRGAWKFHKMRQTWLLNNMFDSEQITDEKFTVLLWYLEGLRGGSRDITVQKALALVQESGDAPEDEDVQKRAHRAREVIQILS